MAFVTKEWKDRLVEFAGRRKLKNVTSGAETVFDVSRSEGAVSQAGDAFSAANMNNLEQRIKKEFDTVNGSLNGKASKSSDLGNCTFYQSGSDFYVRGADSVTKKLGSMPELVTAVSSLQTSCAFTFNVAGNYLIVVSTSNDNVMPDNSLSGVSASTLSDVSRGSWTGGENACNFQHQKVYLVSANAWNTITANGSGRRYYVCMSIFKL